MGVSIQCDAHKNYDGLFKPKIPDPKKPLPIEVGCNTHCRRYFVEAEEDEPQSVAEFLKLYRKLYKVEKEIKDSSIDECYHRRKRDAVPILDALFQRCRECLANPAILPKSRLALACKYALNNETALRRYCDDGRLSIDNIFRNVPSRKGGAKCLSVVLLPIFAS